MFRFQCICCGEWHEGMPHYGAPAPAYYYDVPEDERAERTVLGSDTCVIDARWFFVRGCLEIPVLEWAEPYVWGVWASLSADSFRTFETYFEVAQRAHIGPFFGWLSTELAPLVPNTVGLKTMVHLRDHDMRPFIELEPTEHPLAIEQRRGITVARVAEIHAHFAHGDSGAP